MKIEILCLPPWLFENKVLPLLPITKTKKGYEMATPKFLTLDDLYISPFVSRRVYTEDGEVKWVPMERNLAPTGISVIDFIARSMAEGHSDMDWLAQQLGCSRQHMLGWFRTMTGMSARDFRHAYMFRLADDLLRYTSMTYDEVARRAGFTSVSVLSQQYRKYRHRTAHEVRKAIRQPRDEGRYRAYAL